jgi:hypothetical protein
MELVAAGAPSDQLDETSHWPEEVLVYVLGAASAGKLKSEAVKPMKTVSLKE